MLVSILHFLYSSFTDDFNLLGRWRIAFDVGHCETVTSSNIRPANVEPDFEPNVKPLKRARNRTPAVCDSADDFSGGSDEEYAPPSKNKSGRVVRRAESTSSEEETSSEERNEVEIRKFHKPATTTTAAKAVSAASAASAASVLSATLAAKKAARKARAAKAAKKVKALNDLAKAEADLASSDDEPPHPRQRRRAQARARYHLEFAKKDRTPWQCPKCTRVKYQYLSLTHKCSNLGQGFVCQVSFFFLIE